MYLHGEIFHSSVNLRQVCIVFYFSTQSGYSEADLLWILPIFNDFLQHLSFGEVKLPGSRDKGSF